MKTEEEILTEFINELDCGDQGPEFREFVRGTLAFKRYKITEDWDDVKSDLITEVNNIINGE